MAKQEQNLIKLDEFNIQQLPELQNKKQEVSEKLNEFKYVEIVDNSTYEEAKKSRTGVRTLRTTLQKEQKDVEKKIKDHILVPVKNAYDEIISSVLPIENKQQDEVSRWEEIKEQERQEKARLEQERVDGIKKSIGSFREYWEDVISKLTFGEIEPTKDKYSVVVSEFDRNSLEEFEILFTDSVKYLDGVFASRVELLTKEEELRLERERLAEIQAEQNRIISIKTKIDFWEKNWLYVINNLEFRNISVTQNEFETQTALDCQELQSEYAEKRNQIQELLSAKVSQLKEAEEQRIERENFLKEKAEFEEKMRLEEQKKKEAEELLAKSKANEKSEVVVEQTENYHEEAIIFKNGVTEVSEEVAEVMNTFNKVDEEIIHEVDFEETWDSIQEDYRSKWTDYDSLFKYLKDNYNVPTKK